MKKLLHLFSLPVRSKSMIAILAVIFLFRLGYGLCSEFWFEDELQIYLIGLKFFTDGQLPAYGPDIVYTATQIPGSLQGLLTGLPFFIFPFPEAPYIVLNLLSFAALVYFAGYVVKRVPGIPPAFVYIWLLICPWTLNYSTHIVNPSYVLSGSIIFMMGFFESVSLFRAGAMRSGTAFFMMGAGFGWVYQLHMSWILLLPFILFSLIFVFRDYSFRRGMMNVLLFAAGLVSLMVLLIPALMQDGLAALYGTGGNVVFNAQNIAKFPDLLMRFLSFPSFELPRFMGPDTHTRLAMLREYLPLSPFFIFAGIIGLLQPLWLLWSFFRKSIPLKIRLLTATVLVLTWISFFFSVKGPSSHTFYVLFPLAFLFSAYAWESLFLKKWFAVLMIMMLLSGLFVHAAIMHSGFQHKSMYVQREKPLKAIQQKDSSILGNRRYFDKNQ